MNAEHRPLRIVIGSDDAGFEYKQVLARDLMADAGVVEVIDIGVGRDGHTPYPNVGLRAGEMIRAGEADRGLLICGTGMGVAMAAGKVPGVRASVAHDSFSVERLILSNNAQVLTLGQRVIGLELARRLVGEWLTYRFDEDSPSAAKVRVLDDYERLDGR